MIFAENLFGSIAFFTSVVGLLPQIVKAIRTQSTHDISMVMLINYLICSVSWILYAGLSNSGYVLASNILGSIGSIVLIFLKLAFDKKAMYVKHT